MFDQWTRSESGLQSRLEKWTSSSFAFIQICHFWSIDAIIACFHPGLIQHRNRQHHHSTTQTTRFSIARRCSDVQWFSNENRQHHHSNDALFNSYSLGPSLNTTSGYRNAPRVGLRPSNILTVWSWAIMSVVASVGGWWSVRKEKEWTLLCWWWGWWGGDGGSSILTVVVMEAPPYSILTPPAYSPPPPQYAFDSILSTHASGARLRQGVFGMRLGSIWGGWVGSIIRGSWPGSYDKHPPPPHLVGHPYYEEVSGFAWNMIYQSIIHPHDGHPPPHCFF